MTAAPQSLRPLLPIAMSTAAIADGCRDAALSFCRGVQGGWTKRDLAAWLAGPYAAVARLVDAAVAPPVEASRPSTVPPAMDRLAAENIASLLDPAWDTVMACFEALSVGKPDAFLDEAFQRGSLAEAISVRGDIMFVPIHRPRLKLAHRVVSLVLADYLLRAQDYEDGLAFCDACDVVLLGPGAREAGYCTSHMRQSGIVTKEARERAEADDSVDVDLSEL